MRLQLKSMPKLLFAHSFRATQYRANIQPYANRVEITVVTEGSVELVQNGVRRVAHSGDLICNLHHGALHVTANAPHSHHTVCFEALFECCHNDAEDALQMDQLVLAPQKGSSAPELIDKIICSYTLKNLHPVCVQGMLLQLLGEVDRAQRNENAPFSPSEQRYVDLAKRILFDHIAEPINQKRIAEQLGITPEYLCTIFKKVEGKTLVRYGNERKLLHIRELMQTKQISLKQAAGQYGYSDPNYVSRLYQKYYGEALTNAVSVLRAGSFKDAER
jgi:AraC-like DNA-binding protein